MPLLHENPFKKKGKFVVGGGDNVNAVVLFNLFFKAKGSFEIACTEIDFYLICFCFNTCFVFRETCWFTPVSDKYRLHI